MEQLDLKTEGENVSVLKRLAEVCRSCAVTGTLSSTPTAPEWDHSTKHSIPHLLLQVWRKGELGGLSMGTHTSWLLLSSRVFCLKFSFPLWGQYFTSQGCCRNKL